MLKIPFWLPIHKLLVANQRFIYSLFFIFYILIISLIVLGFYLFQFNLDLFLVISEVAGKFGTVALILFLGTLIPGILQRFKIFPLVAASIVLFRRQMGILMFFIATLHSMYISTIPAIMTNSVGLDSLPQNGLTGFVTLLILFPVWLTSNDFSMKKFGKFWKVIQRFTYFALITLFLHVALAELSAALITISVLLLELASWIKIWLLKSRKKTIQPEKLLS